MTIDDELLTADRTLVAALAKRDATAATALLDDEFTWVDCDGRVQKIPPSPSFAETGLISVIHRYDEVATVVVERDKQFVLRIWVSRAQGWRLLAYHEVSQTVPAALHGPGRKD